jgi:hypothetical protein
MRQTVNPLDRLEQAIERVMEGTFSRLFRQSIQPAEIGRKLERAMVANQRISVGTAIVPNDYVVELHPKDFAQIAQYANGLARQMESWLAEFAGERGFTVVDRIRVRFEGSRRAGVHHPRVRATITDQVSERAYRPSPSALPAAQRTQAFEAVGKPVTTTFRLRLLSGSEAGREVAIDRDRVSVGRSEDNDVVFDAPDVSRRHARIERTGGRLRVVDLNSTNGTRVNGITVSVSDLSPGDEVMFGEQRVQVLVRGGARFSSLTRGG